MTSIYAASMGCLAVAPLLAVRWARVCALITLAACLLLAAVGVSASVGDAHPVIGLGSWLGFGDWRCASTGLAASSSRLLA